MDALFPDALARGDIPGAVVVVVAQGTVLFAKGYGSADVAARKPVDPGRTLFRVGSISKTVTWTAVLQLSQAGKLDLDRDVNDYLDFRIPNTFPRPITLRNLLTHTGGFEDTVKNIAFSGSADFLTNEQFLKAWIPARIYPPGTVVAYSNYGGALAGYIVQRVSGEPFEQYVEHHIFAPLGMSLSSFRQPLPGGLDADEATGYRAGKAQAFEFIAPAPAGAMSTTALDMAHFMIAHLQHGRYDERSILDAPSADLMHAVAYQPVPPLNGMALGFYHEDRNGQSIIGHAGGTNYFHSDMHLFLDAGVGIFVAMNAGGIGDAQDGIRRALLANFADRYFPLDTPSEPTLATAFAHARMAAGHYMSSQRSSGNFGSFLGLFNQATLAMNQDGTIELDQIRTPRGMPLRWHEVAPFTWRALGTSARLGMRVENGRVAAIYSDYFAPSSVFLPVSPWQSAAWNLPLLLAALTVLTLALFAWPVGVLVRKIAGRPRKYEGRELIRQRLVRIACFVNLLFIGGLILFIAAVIEPGYVQLTRQIDPWLRLFQIVGVFALAGTCTALYSAYVAWVNGASSWSRATSSLVAAACVAVAWVGISFHVLDPSLNF
jgi:CubicO group peptidase (beta-lactamase class C family)